jgi:putative hemolysin
VHARREKALAMDILPETDLVKTKIFHAMPPLLKGYIHLGAYVGHEAVLDLEFQTTDVFIILPVKNINTRYIKYYGSEAGRYK